MDSIRMPDSATWKAEGDSGTFALSFPDDSSFLVTDTLPKPLGSDTLVIQAWTLSMRTTIAKCRADKDGNLALYTTTTRDSLAIRLLLALDSLRRTSSAIWGSSSDSKVARVSSLVKAYATLLLDGDTRIMGFPTTKPVGIDSQAVIDELLILSAKRGLSISDLRSRFGLDSIALRSEVRALFTRSVLGAGDTLVLFPQSFASTLAIKKIAPSQDTTVSWDTKTLTLAWVTTSKVAATLSGNVLTSANGYYFSTTASLATGTNMFAVVAVDSQGDTARDTLRVVRSTSGDTTAPRIVRVEPTMDTSAEWDTKQIQLEWTVTDDSLLSSVTLDDTVLTSASGLYKATRSLAVGTRVFHLQAKDVHGNIAFDSIRVTRLADASKPVLSRVAGTADTLLYKGISTFTASWTASDNALKSVRIGDSTIVGAAGVYTRTVPIPKDSQWIDIVATDSSGNESRDSLLVRKSDGTRAIAGGRIFAYWLIIGGTATVTWCEESKSDSDTVTNCTTTPGTPSSTTAIRTTIHRFRMDTSLITQSLFLRVMGALSTQEKNCSQDCPVANVTWADAIRFCNRRSLLEGLNPAYDTSSADSSNWTLADTSSGYRLPFLNEYNHVVREGDSSLTTNPAYTADAVWYAGNSGGAPHPVATRAANKLGLRDLVGNLYRLYQTNTALGSKVSSSIAGTSYLSAALAGSSAEISAAGAQTLSPEVGFRCVRPAN